MQWICAEVSFQCLVCTTFFNKISSFLSWDMCFILQNMITNFKIHFYLSLMCKFWLHKMHFKHTYKQHSHLSRSPKIFWHDSSNYIWFTQCWNKKFLSSTDSTATGQGKARKGGKLWEAGGKFSVNRQFVNV